MSRGLHRPIVLLWAICCLGGCDQDQPTIDAGPPTCTNNDDCPTDQHCSSGRCAPGTGNACEQDEDCAAGERCIILTSCGASRCSGNLCVPRTCSDHDDCGGWFCDLGQRTCIPPPSCNALGRCARGFICDLPSNRCLRADPCDMDEHCSDLICVAGHCTRPVACRTSTSCAVDERCIGETCRDPCPATPCQSTEACETSTGICRFACARDAQCPPDTICVETETLPFLCLPAECELDADCDETVGETCEGEEEEHGRCIVVVPCDEQRNCPIGRMCDLASNRCEPLERCRTDRECAGAEYCDIGGFCYPTSRCEAGLCAGGFECVAEICVPSVCRSDAACDGEERCIAGRCQVPVSDFVTEIQIISPSGVVQPGTTKSFAAIAFDQSGNAVPQLSFEWRSSEPSVASIDDSGVATGGSQPGTTQITAAISSLQGIEISPPVQLINLGLRPENALRITAVSMASGAPVRGATVEATNAQNTSTATTSEVGSILFDNLPGPVTLTVAHPDFDYVTLIDITTDDVLVHLPPLAFPGRAGGLEGTFDLAQISTDGVLELALSGTSMPSPISTYAESDVLGGDLFTIQLPVLGFISLPGSVTTSVNIPTLGWVTVKDTFYVRARTGLRAVWAFGGRMTLEGGFSDLNNLLGVMLPHFQTFEHTVEPAMRVVAVPTIVDTDDIDGDSNRSERVPDWERFRSLQLTPDRSQTLRTQLNVGTLPPVRGGTANTLIIMSGVLLPGVGFVPLGLDGQSNEGQGIMTRFTTRMAPAHSGLELGEYAVLASAVHVDSEGVAGPGSSRLFVSKSMPSRIDLTGWLSSPLAVTWSPLAREVRMLPIVDLVRIAFAHETGTWHVYAPTTHGSLRVPIAPLEQIDRTENATITVDVIDLKERVDPNRLFSIDSGPIDYDRATKAFARIDPGH